MLKIGDFSKLSLVSVKALRYYDERGLLNPAHVDTSTGYRFYSASQLTRLNRILAMKDMGLDLSQISFLLDQEPTPDQIRGMLRLKQVELHQQLTAGQAQLTRIEAWLHAFEQEAIMPAYDVVRKSVAPCGSSRHAGSHPKWSSQNSE
jgi:DNA-binding transcriptional MerR regulator